MLVSFVCLLGLILGLERPAARATPSLPPEFAIRPELSGLDQPVNVEFAPDGRVFVTEKAGRLQTFDSLDDSDPTTILDFTQTVNSYLDRGMLGLAVHPDYPQTPHVFLTYTYDAPPGETAPVHGDDCPTSETTGCTVTSRLSRIRIDPATGAFEGEDVLLHGWCQQFTSHSTGDLEFGPDGYLYVSAGEGASFTFVDTGQVGNPCGDPPNEGGALRSQDVLTSVGGEGNDPVGLSGTILRVDPATGAPAPGGPLSGGTVGGDDAVIAHGLRNPFRMAFRPGTNELWLGDVGWGTWEEINRILDVTDQSADNFEWPCREGFDVHLGYGASPLCRDLLDGTLNPVVDTDRQAPVYAYRHGSAVDGCGGSSSVTAVAFEVNSDYPAAYQGALFFGDYSRRCIWVMAPGPDGVPDPGAVSRFASDTGVVDIESGPDGDLFFVDIIEGTVFRLDYEGANRSPTAVVTADRTSGPAPLRVRFDGGRSSDPDGDSLTFSWDFDDDGTIDAVGEQPTHVYGSRGRFTARLVVEDAAGATSDATLSINVEHPPPEVTVSSPLPDFTWGVGDEIVFAATALGSRGEQLGPEHMEWQFLLHHCPVDCHVHFEATFPNVDSGVFIPPDHEYPSWLELVLTVTDDLGAVTTVARELQPQTSLVTLQTEPAGLELVGGTSATAATAPITIEAVEGGQMSVTAPVSQVRDGTTYWLVGWSDGGAGSHSVTVGESNTTLTATYSSRRPAYLGLVATNGRWELPGSPAFYFGVSGDIPFLGDWDGDGTKTPGLYRRSTGLAYVRNSNTTGPADHSFYLGIPGDIPLVGDWNGDGRDTFAVFRPATATFYIRNDLSTGPATTEFVFGVAGDVPFSGDFDGNGITDVALHRVRYGLVYMRLSHTTGTADLEFRWGIGGDLVFAGDWDADGIDTVGLVRASDATVYLRNSHDTGPADASFALLRQGASPVVG